ncbi:MAG: hypothetical protein ACFCUG_06915 [Thiotrichales bacterium]
MNSYALATIGLDAATLTLQQAVLDLACGIELSAWRTVASAAEADAVLIDIESTAGAAFWLPLASTADPDLPVVLLARDTGVAAFPVPRIALPATYPALVGALKSIERSLRLAYRQGQPRRFAESGRLGEALPPVATSAIAVVPVPEIAADRDLAPMESPQAPLTEPFSVGDGAASSTVTSEQNVSLSVGSPAALRVLDPSPTGEIIAQLISDFYRPNPERRVLAPPPRRGKPRWPAAPLTAVAGRVSPASDGAGDGTSTHWAATGASVAAEAFSPPERSPPEAPPAAVLANDEAVIDVALATPVPAAPRGEPPVVVVSSVVSIGGRTARSNASLPIGADAPDAEPSLQGLLPMSSPHPIRELARPSRLFRPQVRLLGLVRALTTQGHATEVIAEDYPPLQILPITGTFLFPAALDAFPDLYTVPVWRFQTRDVTAGQLLPGVKPRPLWQLFYCAALYGSRGRLCQFADPEGQIRLREAPDFTVVPHTPQHLQLAAFMTTQAADFATIARETGVDYATLISFHNACCELQSIQLANPGAARLAPDAPDYCPYGACHRAQPKRTGFFERLRATLQRLVPTHHGPD